MLKLWHGARNFIASIFIFGSILQIFSGEIPPFAFIVSILLGLTISTLYQNKIAGKKRFIICCVLFLMFGVSLPSTQENTKAIKAEKVTKTPETEKQEEKPLYDPSIIYTISTKKGEGYDELIDKYGIEGCEKINKLMPKAANLIAKSEKCDKLTHISLASESTPENIVIYGYCENKSRFYMPEQDINENKPAITRKHKLEQMEFMLWNACDEIVKSQLNYPSTFDKSILDSGGSVDNDKATVIVGFTAKNAYNLELRYRAICIFNDKPELVHFEMREKR